MSKTWPQHQSTQFSGKSVAQVKHYSTPLVNNGMKACTWYRNRHKKSFCGFSEAPSKSYLQKYAHPSPNLP